MKILSYPVNKYMSLLKDTEPIFCANGPRQKQYHNLKRMKRIPVLDKQKHNNPERESEFKTLSYIEEQH